MDNQKIIIIILSFIIVLLICGILMFTPLITGENSNLAIVDKNINAGDSLTVIVTDSHNNPLSDKSVNIKVSDENGVISDENIITNYNGEANLKIEEKGLYTVECNFKGDNQFSSSSITETITVEATTQLVNDETATHTSKYASDGSIYPEYGPDVDSQGITREYAIANNMHYIEMEVDGDSPGETVTVGGYVAYDPVAGCYHT